MKSLGQVGVLFLVGSLFITGCSSSQTKDGDSSDIIPSAVDAGTDIVPSPTADGSTPPPPGDGSIPPAPSFDSSTMPPMADASSPPIPMSSPSIDSTPSMSSTPSMPGMPSSTDPTMPSTPSMPSTDLSASTGMSSPSSMDSSSTPGTNESSETVSYSVKRGDTLMKISFEVYGDIYHWKKIYESNKDKMHDANTLAAGTTLTMFKPNNPPTMDQNGEKYLIKQGDTLGKISDSLYGTPTKWKTLWENNKQLIHNPNKIFAGFYLYYTPSDHTPGDVRSPAAAATETPVTDPSAGAAPAVIPDSTTAMPTTDMPPVATMPAATMPPAVTPPAPGVPATP